MLSMSEIDLEGISIEIDGSENIGELQPQYIEQDTGLPNYDFSKTSVYIKGRDQDSISYIGLSKLSPSETRNIGITIKNVGVSRKQNLPLRIDLFSEEANTWLIEEGNSFIINFRLPHKEMFQNGLSGFKLVNIVYKKRD